MAGPLFAAKLPLAIKRIAARTDRPVLNASLVLVPIVHVVPSQSGQQVDQNAAVAAAITYLTAFDSETLIFPTATQQPLTGPVMLDAADQSFTVPPATGTVTSLHPRLTSTDLQPFVTKTQKRLNQGLVLVADKAAIAKIDAGWQSGRVVLPCTTSTMTIDDAYLAKLNGDLKQVIQERTTPFYGSISRARAQHCARPLENKWHPRASRRNVFLQPRRRSHDACHGLPVGFRLFDRK